MFYTFDKLDQLFKDLSTKETTYSYGGSIFDIEKLEDDKQRLIINTLGHNPKDIKVDVTEDEIKIKATKPESSSRFVKDIDLAFTVGKDYDGTKTEAKFENGLLTILIDKKLERKSKTLKISF